MHRWGSNTPPSPSFGPSGPGIRVGGVQPDIATIGDIYYNFDLMNVVSDHGSRRTWGSGPSRSGFEVQKGDLPQLN